MALLDALGYVGETLDKPGRAMRGLLAGRPGELLNLVPFSDTMGLTDPTTATRGTDLLAALGMDPESISTQALGTAAEVALDPLNLIGAGFLGRALGGRRAALAQNLRRESLIAKGAMPEEIAKLTKAVDSSGRPIKTFHGTASAFENVDLTKTDPRGLYGRGYYTTENPAIASEYALQAESRGLLDPNLENVGPNVRAQFLDIRNPFDVTKPISQPEVQAFISRLIERHPPLAGSRLHKSLEQVAPKIEDYGRLWGEVVNETRRKETARKLLEHLGYDALIHTGGQAFGRVPHRVTIAWNPSQVYKPVIAPMEMPVPRVNPILASLGGYNVLTRQ